MSDGITDDIESTLGLGRYGGRKKRFTWWIFAALIVSCLLVILALLMGGKDEQNGQSYVTGQVTRGDLSVTVTATGTLEPVTQVDVGSELSGIIDTVEVDFNSQVKAGDVLARLDTTSLNAQVIKARAALNSAKAQLTEARTTLKENEAQLRKLRKGWELSGGKVPSERELDSAEAAVDRAEAAVVTAKAQIAEAKANLTVNETSLSKAVIRSPIDGVVLNRAVEPGQTVAASLQAPILFTIAETLTQMELHVFVDEADVGQIEKGQKAIFTVDAYPDRSFDAEITEVRFTPTETDGVVTYETVLTVDNTDLSLRPGMTATAEIATQHVEDVLLVPNAALRFSPKQLQQNRQDRGLVEKLLPRRPRRPKESRIKNGHRVWVLTGDEEHPLRPIQVKTGPTDGTVTVIREGQLEPGQTLVVGVETSGK
jgi:HlyD family secretion protein